MGNQDPNIRDTYVLQKKKKVYKNRWTKYKKFINIQRLFISKTNMSVKIVSALKYERPRVPGTR